MTPLIGSTGMMKKSVTKFIPFLTLKTPTVPHCEHRIVGPPGSEPQVMKRVPKMKMKKNNVGRTSQRFAARAFFAAEGFFFGAPTAFVCGLAASRRADASRAAGDSS